MITSLISKISALGMAGLLCLGLFANNPAGHFASTSLRWSGYTTQTSLTTPQPGSVTTVSGQWSVPKVTCAKTKTYSLTWVGLDGASDSTVEQTGTEQDCASGKAVYKSWYEVFPQQAEKYFSLTVHAGDVMQGTVTYVSGTSYTMALKDVTTGKSTSTKQSSKNAQRESAEWIVEAPQATAGGSSLALANFTPVTFTNASAIISGVTGTISGADRVFDPVSMVNSSGQVLASPSALSAQGSSFTVSHS